VSIGQCQTQIKSLTNCLVKEKNRIVSKENELRELVETGRIPDSIKEKAVYMAQATDKIIEQQTTEKEEYI
jgi:hypothetical protein